MDYCNRCNINIDTKKEYCPLCLQRTNKNDDCYEKDFPKDIENSTSASSMANRIITFIYLCLLGGYLTINIALNIKDKWLLYAIIAITYIYCIIRLELKYRKGVGFKVVTNVLLLSTVLFILDKISGNYKWAVNFVIPFLILAGILILVSISAGRVYFKDYISYIFVISALGIGMLIFVLTGIATVKWPSLITIGISILQVVIMFTFVRRKTTDELKKRFHM